MPLRLLGTVTTTPSLRWPPGARRGCRRVFQLRCLRPAALLAASSVASLNSLASPPPPRAQRPRSELTKVEADRLRLLGGDRVKVLEDDGTIADQQIEHVPCNSNSDLNVSLLESVLY